MTEKVKAQELAQFQKEISIAEFFTKNRHLLGFDSARKAILIGVKEAVDNALDACQESHILPEITVEIKAIEGKEDRLIMIVEDNGPGIVKENIGNVFGKLLYGSKFHRLRQSRGQQGIGISAAVLYGQLTTGKNAKITSKIGKNHPAHYYEMHVDTKTNNPVIVKEKTENWTHKENGTRVEIEMEAQYQKGKQSVDEYIKQTAIANPAATIKYTNPLNEKTTFPKSTQELPKEPKEIKPHPYGIELGIFIRMLQGTEEGTIASFLHKEFSRVSQQQAAEMCEKVQIGPRTRPKTILREDAEKLYQAMQQAQLMAPPTDCLSPIGEETLLSGIKKEINADFYATCTRKPAVYRGNPFQIEVGVAYGGDLDKEETVRVMRLANRVPLLYQAGACAITKAILETNWKAYGLQQSKSSIPSGPAIIIVHMASVWVPFTSESKEAIAHYDEILKEIKLGLQECGRKLTAYIRKHVHAEEQKKKAELFEKLIPELANALAELAEEKREPIIAGLMKKLEQKLPMLLGEANDTKQSETKA